MKNSPDKTAEKIEKNGVYNDNKNPGTTGEEVFTDEEVKILEKELIETYIRSSDSPVKTLFKMYKKYIPEIILSLIFYFLKTLPVMVLPIITAEIINLVTKPPGGFYQTSHNLYCYHGSSFSPQHTNTYASYQISQHCFKKSGGGAEGSYGAKASAPVYNFP